MSDIMLLQYFNYLPPCFCNNTKEYSCRPEVLRKFCKKWKAC